MFEPVKRAELQPHDLAKLLKLNRITVSMWLNDHAMPHRLHRAKVQELVDAIQVALDDGKFPVPHDISRRERGLYIRKALAPHWQD